MKKLIVVIEDDRDILDLIQYILIEEGYKVIGYDRIERIESIIAKQPSLILLDNRLADGYGNTLCLELKSHVLGKNIPVILVSASGNLGQVAKACGADGILQKPFDLAELIAIVKRYHNSDSLVKSGGI